MRSCGWLFFLLLTPGLALAQLSWYGGALASKVHQHHLVGTTHPQMGYQSGICFRASSSPIAPFYPGVSLEVARKGYTQVVDAIDHVFRLTYITLSPQMSYRPIDRWSATVGIDISGLLRARYQQEFQDVGVIENYREGDFGLRGEMQWQVGGPVSIYASYRHGLRNLLKYPAITETGEIIGTIRDLQTRAVSLGVRVDIMPVFSNVKSSQ